MRLLMLLLVVLAALALTSCSGNDDNGEVSAVSSEPTPAYDVDAIWPALAPGSSPTPPDVNLTRSLLQCRAPPSGTACVTGVMQGAGATAAAIDFLETTGWFLIALDDLGPVDLGTIVSPWRANANRQYVMLNGEPELVYAEDEGAKLKLTSDPAYQPLVDAVTASGTTAPGLPVNVVIFAADNAFEEQISVEQGGQRIVFQYDIVNGCHTCGTGYRERVGFDFDTTGRYRMATLLGICRGGQATPDVPNVAPCPPTRS